MTAEQRQLEEEGYTFHGAYSWRKDEIKRQAAELRAQGHKARMVYEPASKYSRGGGGGGWSIYWIESEESKAAKAKAKTERAIANLEREREEITNRLAVIADLLSGLQGEK